MVSPLRFGTIIQLHFPKKPSDESIDGLKSKLKLTQEMAQLSPAITDGYSVQFQTNVTQKLEDGVEALEEHETIAGSLVGFANTLYPREALGAIARSLISTIHSIGDFYVQPHPPAEPLVITFKPYSAEEPNKKLFQVEPWQGQY